MSNKLYMSSVLYIHLVCLLPDTILALTADIEDCNSSCCMYGNLIKLYFTVLNIMEWEIWS